jgi:hypothetical protein
MAKFSYLDHIRNKVALAFFGREEALHNGLLGDRVMSIITHFSEFDGKIVCVWHFLN